MPADPEVVDAKTAHQQIGSDADRWTFSKLMQARAAELEHIMATGGAPDQQALAGFEYRGLNHPWFTRLMGIQKFVKGFFRPRSAEKDLPLMGYNCPVIQDGPEKAWRTKPVGQEPKRFGFYHVYPVRRDSRDDRYPQSLLLDYGASSRNPRLSPVRLLRDYLVRVRLDSDELLLGKAYLALGPFRLATSFFILERLRQHNFRPNSR